MSYSFIIHCDKCDGESWVASYEEEHQIPADVEQTPFGIWAVIARAISYGWLIRPDGAALCKEHSGLEPMPIDAAVAKARILRRDVALTAVDPSAAQIVMSADMLQRLGPDMREAVEGCRVLGYGKGS